MCTRTCKKYLQSIVGGPNRSDDAVSGGFGWALRGCGLMDGAGGSGGGIIFFSGGRLDAAGPVFPLGSVGGFRSGQREEGGSDVGADDLTGRKQRRGGLRCFDKTCLMFYCCLCPAFLFKEASVCASKCSTCVLYHGRASFFPLE